MSAVPEISNTEAPLSPWWIRSILAVLIVGFAVLLMNTLLAYTAAPPIPARVQTKSGQLVFTGADVRAGQEVFLRYGLMDNGTFWGHGAYLGPDYPAQYLHMLGVNSSEMLAQSQYDQPFATLTPVEQAAVQGQVAVQLKQNRYDAARNTLVFTSAEAATFTRQVAYWTGYFRKPAVDGGLKPNLITDPTQLRELAAFFAWGAWASVADRPGEKYTYTNNFPFDPSVGNTPTGTALLWSALSLIALLAGIAAVLLAFGKFDYLGWTNRDRYVKPRILAAVSPSQCATVKFCVLATLLLLTQTLVGGAVAHYRVDPSSFYGLPLDKLFPSNLMRTWHLQTALFWITTAFVASSLFLGHSLGKNEPGYVTNLIHVLFVALLVVIGGSLLGEWLGMSQLLGKWWFWIGDQGWEYLEIGRLWQILLVIGLFLWFALLYSITRPRNVEPDAKALSRMFLLASLAIPMFYIPAMFYDSTTNYTVVDTWRFWIVHLWTEGFFEFFATTTVAVTFFQLGLASKNTALRVIYLDAILYFGGGIIGTGHHWYFNGHAEINMALSSIFGTLEVVPLTLLTLDAWDFVRMTHRRDGEPVVISHKWTFYFLMAVGFWNFVGAGILGFLLNLPIVSYYESGTLLTPAHAHGALMGVFGMLAVGMMVFVLRRTTSNERWPGIEKYIKVCFWGLNGGLALMLVLSLFPEGVLQLWDVIQHGYWHARGAAFNDSGTKIMLEWLRLPADLVFIIFGAVPLLVAVIKAYLGMRKDRTEPVVPPVNTRAGSA
jgi:nitric oxide reductase subunit B